MLCMHLLARACRVPVGRRLDGRQATMSDATKTIFIFFIFFFPVLHPSPLHPRFFPIVIFSHRWSARIKQPITQKLTGAPKNLVVDTFPDPSAILKNHNVYTFSCKTDMVFLNMVFHQILRYFTELSHQILFYLAEMFRQMTCHFMEMFRQIAFSLPCSNWKRFNFKGD